MSDNLNHLSYLVRCLEANVSAGEIRFTLTFACSRSNKELEKLENQKAPEWVKEVWAILQYSRHFGHLSLETTT